MKKLSIFLTVAMVLTLILSACAPKAEPVSLEGVTIQFWHVYSDEPGEALQALVDEFNDVNEYGITVEGLTGRLVFCRFRG